MVKLIIEDDEGKTTVVPLIRDEITIGRKEGNTIRLTERNVSRRHARLLRQNGALFIEDLSSYNGIKVNGNKISGRIAITEGDRIQIGDYVLGLKFEGQLETAQEGIKQTKSLKMPAAVERPKTERMEQPNDASAPNQSESFNKHTDDRVKPEHVARIVCISNNFPGQEWVLQKPIMVLGRTEDNDIVVNHRSISRHHASINEENGRFTIIDLQSSNGVRVNGEEYGKVELRRGDLIDLGHVRLRFIAPGEDFDFERDASIVDISGGNSSHGLLWAAIIVLAAVTVGFVLWRISSSSTEENTSALNEPHVETVLDKGVAQPEPPDTSVLIAQINRAFSSEQWPEVLKLCEQLQGDIREDVKSNCEKAKIEKEAFVNFEKVHSASLQNDHLAVIRIYNQIPEESVYKKRDLHIISNAKAAYLTTARKSLQEMVQKHSCEQALSIAKTINEVDPSDARAERVAHRCVSKEAAVNQHQNENRPPRAANKTSLPRPTPRRPTPRSPTPRLWFRIWKSSIKPSRF